MEPYFIPIILDKFQVCACFGCDGDAVTQFAVRLDGGISYFIAGCTKTAHRIQAKACIASIEAGRTPDALHKEGLVDIEEVFIQPAGRDEKCKLLQWQAYQADPTATTPWPQPSVTTQAQRPSEEEPTQVSDDWVWETRMGWWRRIDGKKVRIENLSLSEFISSVQAIVSVNFARVTKRIAWAKTLGNPHTNYEYPQEVLEVGYEEAGRKLEEFQEDAGVRELL